MAYDIAYMENPRTGQIRPAPLGFSWTMFLFGFFPTMFRGDWKWFGIILGSALVLSLLSVGLLGWVPGLIGAFIWNKHYLRGLIQDGYRLKSTQRGNLEGVDAEAGFHAPRLVAGDLA